MQRTWTRRMMQVGHMSTARAIPPPTFGVGSSVWETQLHGAKRQRKLGCSHNAGDTLPHSTTQGGVYGRRPQLPNSSGQRRMP